MPRLRKSISLTLMEREEISRGLLSGRSFGQLGRDLGRTISTISREVARNGGRRAYRATRVDERALDRAHRPKTLPTGIQSSPVQTGRRKAIGSMVTAADRRLAEGPVS